MHNNTKKINNQDSSTKFPSTTIESIKDTESKKLDSNGDEIVWELKRTKNIFFCINFLWSMLFRFCVLCFLAYIVFVYFDKLHFLILLPIALIMLYYLFGVALSLNLKTIQITHNNFILKKYIGSDIILPLGSFYICEEDEIIKISFDTIIAIRKLAIKATFPKYFFIDFGNTNIQEIYETIKPYIKNSLIQMNQSDYDYFKNNSLFKDGLPSNYIDFDKIDKLRKEKEKNG